jgi:TonB-dependent Receptor Plug Domain
VHAGIRVIPESIRSALLAGLAALPLLAASAVVAQESPLPSSDDAMATTDADGRPIEEILVFGRAEEQIGMARAGSEGRVGHADLTLRPIGRVGELLEAVPGVIATQHSGSGKANQLFLRGFNLDHGTDFATFFDGVPVNFRSHGHGQGYTDLNFVIPELVEEIDYRKGPYRADVGDFGSAGASFLKTYDRLPDSIALVTYGQYDFVRGLAASSFEVGEGDAILAIEGRTNADPYHLDANLLHLNGFTKWTGEAFGGTLRASALGYHATWNSTDQIPARAIGNPDPARDVSRLGWIDDDLGGETTRVGATLDWRAPGDDPLSASTYFLYYDFQLFSNFTYFLDDPIDGDEFEQRDRRFSWGANVGKRWTLELAGREVAITTGLQSHLDRIPDLGLFETNERQKVSVVRRDAVTQWSGSLFAEAHHDPLDWMTLVAGLRSDLYAFDVDTRSGANGSAAANAGAEIDGLVHPKLAVIVRPHPTVELYLNGGGGFHSNDARGTTLEIDPASGDPVPSVDALARQWGSEIGARWQPDQRFHLTSVFWFLDSESELVFVGDAGTTEPKSGSQRFGVELTGFLRPLRWLALDASYSWSDARFDSLPDGRDRIPGGLEHVVSAGATVTAGNFSSSLRLRHFAAYPLLEDNTQRAGSTTLVNWGTAHTWRRLTLDLTVVNLFDSKDADIQYFYESRLAGEIGPDPLDPLPPTADTHLHPVEPRQLRATVRVAF